jgi:hypothetical protein
MFIDPVLDVDPPDPLLGRDWRELADQVLARSWCRYLSDDDVNFVQDILDRWQGPLTPRQAWRLRKLAEHVGVWLSAP